MLSSVDLPQPDGPITATNSPGCHREVDAAQRAHRRALGLEGLAQAPRLTTTGRSRVDASLTSLIALRSMSSNTSMRYARTGVFRPFTSRLAERHALERRRAAPRTSLSLITIRPAGRARSCRRCARFTVSPTSVYSSRSSEPSSAAATGPVDTPMPEPERRRARRAAQRSFERALALEHRARGARPRGRRGRRAGTGAPKHAITASPTNCITVPPSSRMAWFISARCSLSWRGELRRVAALGDRRSSRGCRPSAR